jgi:hypothetical protein
MQQERIRRAEAQIDRAALLLNTEGATARD